MGGDRSRGNMGCGDIGQGTVKEGQCVSTVGEEGVRLCDYCTFGG